MLWDNLQAYSESAAQGRYGICRVVTSVLLDPWISFYTYSPDNSNDDSCTQSHKTWNVSKGDDFNNVSCT